MIVKAVNEMVAMEEPTLTEFSKPLQKADRKELTPVKFSDYGLIFMIKAWVDAEFYKGYLPP